MSSETGEQEADDCKDDNESGDFANPGSKTVLSTIASLPDRCAVSLSIDTPEDIVYFT